MYVGSVIIAAVITYGVAILQGLKSYPITFVWIGSGPEEVIFFSRRESKAAASVDTYSLSLHY